MDNHSNAMDASRLLTVFSLGESLFALDAIRIQEIIRVGTITPVHHAPGHVLGVINLRGHIVTVLDPASRLGMEPQPCSPENRILIVDGQDEQIGVMVSRIQDMVPTEGRDITDPPSNLKKRLGRFLVGVVQIKEAMVSVLDPNPLLSVEETA